VRIAIIGCGEVGRTYAEAVAAQGRHQLVLNDSHPSPPAKEMAARLGLELHTTAGDWLGEVDRVWVCVTGDVAKNVCAAIVGHLNAGAVVVDLTTATPADKRDMAAQMSDCSHAYVDAVIMGAIGLTGVKTALLGAGPHSADALADLAELGAPVRSLPEAKPGDAAALKLLRTVLTKGLEALGVECLIAAEQQGVRNELYQVLGDIDSAGLTHFLNAVVRTHILHAERRMHEIQRADAQLEQFGLPSLLMGASEQRFALTTKALTQTPPAPGTADDIDSAVAWLLETTAASVQAAH